jgi:hypothetical protein
MLVLRAAGRQGIIEAGEVILGSKQEGSAVAAHGKPRAAGEGPLEHTEPAVGLHSEEEQLARPIGGEGNGAAGAVKPAFQPTRCGECEGSRGYSFILFR